MSVVGLFDRLLSGPRSGREATRRRPSGVGQQPEHAEAERVYVHTARDSGYARGKGPLPTGPRHRRRGS